MSPSLLIGNDAVAIPPFDFKAVMQSPAQMQNVDRGAVSARAYRFIKVKCFRHL
jgi:hypothetical protein